MGSFSYWHWMIVLAVLFPMAAVPSVIVSANRKKRLGRRGYAIRTIGFFLVALAVASVPWGLVGFWPMAGIFTVTWLAFAILSLLWSVHRTQDIGWPNWLCLLFALPFGNVFLWLLLVIMPGRRSDSEVAVAVAI